MFVEGLAEKWQGVNQRLEEVRSGADQFLHDERGGIRFTPYRLLSLAERLIINTGIIPRDSITEVINNRGETEQRIDLPEDGKDGQRALVFIPIMFGGLSLSIPLSLLLIRGADFLLEASGSARISGNGWAHLGIFGASYVISGVAATVASIGAISRIR